MPLVIQAFPSDRHRLQLVRTSSNHHNENNKVAEEVKKLNDELKKVQSKLAEKEQEEMLRAVRAEEFQKGEKSGLAKVEKKDEEDRKLKALIAEVTGGGNGAGMNRYLPPGYMDDGHDFPVGAEHLRGGGGGGGRGGNTAFAHHFPPIPPHPLYPRPAHFYHSHSHAHSHIHTLRAPHQKPIGIPLRTEAIEIHEGDEEHSKLLHLQFEKQNKNGYTPILGIGSGSRPQFLLSEKDHPERMNHLFEKFPELPRESVEEIYIRLFGNGNGNGEEL